MMRLLKMRQLQPISRISDSKSSRLQITRTEKGKLRGECERVSLDESYSTNSIFSSHRATARKFLAAANFLELLTVFGEVGTEVSLLSYSTTLRLLTSSSTESRKDQVLEMESYRHCESVQRRTNSRSRTCRRITRDRRSSSRSESCYSS